MTAHDRRRSWWGWGWQDEALSGTQVSALADTLAARFNRPVEVRSAPSLSALELPPPRVTPPPLLAPLCSTDLEVRAGHTHGKSFRDVVQGFHGEFSHPPDVVAHPRSELDLVAVLDWCGEAGAAVIPYGGGSSVVGGVSCDVGPRYPGVVSIDLTSMDRVIDIDRTSRAACIQAGALGPVLEAQLRPHGYTLRHFPQSFEHSTLGGWIATRSGGHFATNYTHIDDLVESVRAVTPAGSWESRRLPGSGAGPSPDRLWLGSEGILGIITSAWMRLQDRPTWKASASLRFGSWDSAVAAVRAVSQAGLFPSNCRLLDAGEAASSAGVTDGASVLVLGFESADHPLSAWIERAVECCTDHGGTLPDGVRTSSTEGAAGAWRASFLRAPYGRDALVAMGWVADTFETAVTWDQFPSLHSAVSASVGDTLKEVCGGGAVTCRFTHVYPDGCAPYFTVVAPSTHDSQLTHWDAIKTSASEAILRSGGTITHHHAVGRDHRPWYEAQRPTLMGEVLRAAKATLDPDALMNPGVLVDALK